MNPVGISVFYGALSEKTAIAEVRPSVGGLVVVGRFMPTRKLILLDLSKIRISFTGSIFHPDYEDYASRSQFLEGFHVLITKPVQPSDELLEYIPTQAVLYASAQVGAVPEVFDPSPYIHEEELSEEELKGYNVVLFKKAEIVNQSTFRS